LAGKTAIFDVTVLEASKRTLPEVTDEFANEVRAGLTAETLKKELQTAVDTEDAKEYTPARNAALAKALAQVMDVEVPDTLVTNQAREKFAMMMADMRNNGVNDDEIKNQINSENFLKYKNIVKDDIIKDFKVSMATDEIARLENIEVEDYQVEEQMESIKQDAENSKEDFDETQIRSRVEATLLRQAVMDFLAEKADLEVKFVDGDGEFDESLMEKLAEESQAREESFKVETTEESEADESPAVVVEASATEEKEVEETAAVVEEEKEETPIAEPVAEDRDLESMSLADKAFYALKDAGALDADGAK
jgi:trigger factor